MERFKKIAKALLWPHWSIIVLVCIAAAALLCWVFWNGYEESPVAYLIYVLSAYALSAACIALVPVIARYIKKFKNFHAAMTPTQKGKWFRMTLYIGLGINLVYAAFNLIAGIAYNSVWMWSSGLYYLVLTVIHSVLLGYERKLEGLDEDQMRLRLGWSGFQFCGVMLLALHLTMTGVVFQMIWQGQVDSYPGYFIFAMAAYTFYKLIKAIIRVIRFKKNPSPIMGASRNIDLSEALMSLFSLQAGMLAAFGGEIGFQYLMNTLTGGAICLMAVLGAIGMILHGRKRKKEILGDMEHGK